MKLAAVMTVNVIGLFYFYYGPIIYHYHRSTVTLIPAVLCTTSALLDVLIISFHVWSIARTAIISLHIILAWSFVGKHHFEELNSLLALALLGETAKTAEGGSLSLENCSSHFEIFQLLRRFYREYHWLLSILQRFNRQIVSQIYFTAIVSNIAANLVIIANLLFRNLPPVAITIMILFIFFQTLIAYVAAHGLANISNCFHQSDHLLYQLQLKITCNWQNTKQLNQTKLKLIYLKSLWISQKLKLAVFYEMVCTTNKFCFTFGEHSKINHKTMFEFMFVYSGFIMYVSKMVKNERL